MDYNVLVLAMSILPFAATNAKTISEYVLTDGDKKYGPYKGIGQLEAVPLLIQDKFDCHITHVVILATDKTKEAVSYVQNDARATYARIVDLYGDRLDLTSRVEDALGEKNTISHLEFFERRMLLELSDLSEGVRPEFTAIEVGMQDPSIGLNKLQAKIRELYARCKNDGGTWRLWMETHGGFRDLSMAMFGLMQMLAAPDERSFAKYTTDEELSNAIMRMGDNDLNKRMGDGRSIVPITGVYTIEYDFGLAKQGIPQTIWDRTTFYKTFTKPAITSYLNYGQYVQMMLKADATDKPYAFISYRREEARLERYALLGSMKRFGYRYWYDDAIELQQKWQDVLDDAVNGCAAFIAVITETYYDSVSCLKEFRQALDQKKLMILVSPDKTDMFHGCKEINKYGIVIREEELKELAERQQLSMDAHIINDVFQEAAVEDRLQKLCDYDERFKAVKA